MAAQQLWEHAPVILPLDVQQFSAHLANREPDGWELVSVCVIAVGGSAHLDGNGQLVPGSPQPAFLVVFKRPKPVAPVE